MPTQLATFDTQALPAIMTDVLVIGCGVAGLSCAIEAARGGRRVLLVNKGKIADSNTQWAQGGIAATMDRKPDSIEGHVLDTIEAGDGLCNEHMVRLIIGSSADAVEFLRDCGCNFDLDGSGEPAVGQEAAHRVPRILHAGGDATGAEIERSLLSAAKRERQVWPCEETFVLELLVSKGVCQGALIHRNGELEAVSAGAVVLASGGCGRLYRESSNSPVATGDGHAMAARAGAVMRDMEMIQFHPTLLYAAGAPRTLLTEALRGAGGILRNSAGERFMERYDTRLELAPRDVVARAINSEMRLTGDEACFLDVTHLGVSLIQSHFPSFAALCDKFGIDYARSWVPVRPGPHYMIGGVATDDTSSTNIEGLYAVGEACSSGFHGANRLASNSLLEGVVMGRRLGLQLAKERRRHSLELSFRNERTSVERPLDFVDLKNTFRSLMLRHMGVERGESGMAQLARRLDGWRKLLDTTALSGRKQWELANMLQVAAAMTECARFRKESRGVHWRTDYPAADAAMAQRHVSWSWETGAAWESPSTTSGGRT
jgi:L-aspartate oxidase